VAAADTVARLAVRILLLPPALLLWLMALRRCTVRMDNPPLRRRRFLDVHLMAC